MSNHYDTIVIGAGQAGLAAGYFLKRAGTRFLIVDGADAAGDSWMRRWDSLRLFTTARYNGLPGMRFPGRADALPARDDVARYLQRYASHFQLPMAFGSRVQSLEYEGGRFVVDSGGVRLTSDSVIVATGAYHKPFVPAFAGRLAAGILQLHSSEYRNPEQLGEGEALVVGAGNSGAQIAIELAASRRLWLSGRDTGSIPRRILGVDVYRWLWPTLMRPTVNSRLGRRLMNGRLFAGDPLVGIAATDLALPTLSRVGRTVDAVDGLPVIEGHGGLDVSAVIWCTGFRPAFDWIRLPVFERNGYPRHQRGLVPEAPGLAFLGLRYQHRMSSALLGGVGEDAAFVVSSLQRPPRGSIPITYGIDTPRAPGTTISQRVQRTAPHGQRRGSPGLTFVRPPDP